MASTKKGSPYGSPQLVPRSISKKKFGTEFDEVAFPLLKVEEIKNFDY